MEKDLSELSAEVTAVSMIVLGLSNQLDNKNSDSLTLDSLGEALFGIASYLERIAQDLGA